MLPHVSLLHWVGVNLEFTWGLETYRFRYRRCRKGILPQNTFHYLISFSQMGEWWKLQSRKLPIPSEKRLHFNCTRKRGIIMYPVTLKHIISSQRLQGWSGKFFHYLISLSPLPKCKTPCYAWVSLKVQEITPTPCYSLLLCRNLVNDNRDVFGIRDDNQFMLLRPESQ